MRIINSHVMTTALGGTDKIPKEPQNREESEVSQKYWNKSIKHER